ncbi:MAG: acyl--CoA ligase, partial [Thermoanaerobaculia bacterium]|nr:acyl--CoA ligase [Thermoanaerobaculia bacterium]
GETGEIRIAGPATFERYLDAGETRPFDASGRLETGDMGYLDETGELVVRGRAAYAIRARDRWVCAEELEAAAREHPGISEAAALPEGDSFALLVETADSSAAFRRDMRAFLVRRLPSFARPKLLVCLPEIPRGPGGKVDRAAASRWIPAP